MNIKEIVVKYFGLDDKSKERFSEAYDTPFVDDVYKPYIDSEYRIRIPLSGNLYESFDRGWVTLKSVLPDLVSEYNITYEDFYNNKKLYEKNSYRIIKLIRSYFTTDLSYDKIQVFLERMSRYERDKFHEYESYCYENDLHLVNKENVLKAVNLFIDRINELRFSKTKNIEIVLSLNRTDWFLSTTNENWRTCLSLESPSFASYWVSLAGAVVDKNLALLYITNGDKKEYLGNKMDKVLSRSWVLLDKGSFLNTVKFYPNSLLGVKDIDKLLPIPIKEIDRKFEGKYRVEPLFFRNGYSNYIYQDKTNSVDYKDGSFKLVGGDKGLRTFYKHSVFEGPIFSYTKGLMTLINMAEEAECRDIVSFFDYPRTCSYCNNLVSKARVFKIHEDDEEVYCRKCYEDGNTLSRRNNNEDEDEDEDIKYTAMSSYFMPNNNIIYNERVFNSLRSFSSPIMDGDAVVAIDDNDNNLLKKN